MRIAFFSDIHSNNEAFQRVLGDIHAQKVDQMACLGDCIGYGPEPESVIKTIRRLKVPTVIGNHELAACDPDHLSWFNPMARKSLKKNLAMVSSETMEYIKQLPKNMVIGDCFNVHGFPPDSVKAYLFQKSKQDIIKALESIKERICFIGHTHDLEIISYDGNTLSRKKLKQGITELNSHNHYMINVGSVGQPRDGNHDAKYIIYNQKAGQIDVRFIPYDIAVTIKKIKAAGLPVQHANRLR
ncbi:MAG: metallophosphoesterase family protein [Desulfobacteraceae bacterium]|nr:metallophosphoesterase family protein [Desulfobacteraceae bacterium]